MIRLQTIDKRVRLAGVVFLCLLCLFDSAAAVAQSTTQDELNSIYTGTPFYDPNSLATNCSVNGNPLTTPSGDLGGGDSDTTAADALASMSIDQKIAQTFIIGFAPSQAATAQQIAQKYHIGGIAILGNHDDKVFNKAYFDSLNSVAGPVPLMIAADQEGGKVQRFDQTQAVGNQPSAKDMGAMSDQQVETIGQQTGLGLHSLGVTVDLAPVLDIDNGVNSISTQQRSFSSDPNVVVAKAGAFASGLQKGGVSPIFKHFPGHGNASGTGNSDNGIVTTPDLASLKTKDLIPYQRLANQYGAGVMLGNLIVPGLTEDAKTPTSMSPATVNLLRNNYGFTGLIMTDDLHAGAITAQNISLPDAIQRALAAGVDAPLFSFTTDGDIQQAIDQIKASVSPDVITAAATKMINFKNSNLQPNETPTTTADGGTTTLPVGSNVYVLGDSITAMSKNAYLTAFQEKGITASIDGSSSRSLNGPGVDGNKLTGMQAITQDASQIQKANAIVVALGTNAGETANTIDAAIAAIRQLNASAPIYWVDTITVGRPAYTATKTSNQAIYAEASTQNYTVISWAKTVDPNSDPTNLTGNEADPQGYIIPYATNPNASLGVHPTTAGIGALVSLVVGKVVSGGGGNLGSVSNCCNMGSLDTNLLGADNIEKAFNFYVQKGLSPAQSAGIIGNMMHESPGLDPTRLQGDFDKENPSATILDKLSNRNLGWGIVQWTPPGNIIQTAHDSGIDYAVIDTLSFQLEFVWNQLNGTAWDGNKNNVINEKRAGDALRGAVTAQDAARIFASQYERFKDSNNPDNPQYALRGKSADDVLARYGGSVSVGPATPGASGCGTTGTTHDSPYAGQFTLYTQSDGAWKNDKYGESTIGESGSGPTAMAMIITALTQQHVTPDQVTEFANTVNAFNASTQGSSWNIAALLAPNWGLKATPIVQDSTQISSALQTGGLIITAGAGAAPFTTGGHFIVIRGVTAGGKWKVGDPFGSQTSTQEWDPAQLLNEMKGFEGSTYVITR